MVTANDNAFSHLLAHFGHGAAPNYKGVALPRASAESYLDALDSEIPYAGGDKKAQFQGLRDNIAANLSAHGHGAIVIRDNAATDAAKMANTSRHEHVHIGQYGLSGSGFAEGHIDGPRLHIDAPEDPFQDDHNPPTPSDPKLVKAHDAARRALSQYNKRGDKFWAEFPAWLGSPPVGYACTRTSRGPWHRPRTTQNCFW